MPRPWMQHLGSPIAIEVAPDRASAEMVLGRIIPGRTRTLEGDPLHDWRMSRMDYVPSWIAPAA